jgi:RIO-like serine/threonine protein kinase
MRRKALYVFTDFPTEIAPVIAMQKLIDQDFSNSLGMIIGLGVEALIAKDLKPKELRAFFMKRRALAAAEQMNIDANEPESPYSSYFIKQE